MEELPPYCCGLWNDKQAIEFQKIAKFIDKMGSIPAIQLAHAGRKASAKQPWKGGVPLDSNPEKIEEKPWKPIAPSEIALAEGWQTPRAMSILEINRLIQNYVNSAKRAVAAGFKIIEIHAAHGYLIHSFISNIK